MAFQRYEYREQRLSSYINIVSTVRKIRCRNDRATYFAQEKENFRTQILLDAQACLTGKIVRIIYPDKTSKVAKVEHVVCHLSRGKLCILGTGNEIVVVPFKAQIFVDAS